jgi:DNA-binding NarL/FixJ family response regulator
MKQTLKRITVLLADDHAMVREGFRKLLEAQDDLEVVGEAKNGRLAVAMARKLRPDVVVMDIAMPVLNGLDATRQIRESNPGIKVLMLSAHSDDAYVERAVALGAVGFLVKQSSSNDLSKAIHEAQKGQTFFSSAVAKRLRDRFRKAPQRVPAVAKTADRGEREVGRLMVDGVPQKDIAVALGIGLKKVHRHHRNLMRKVTSAMARSRLRELG